MIFFSAAATPSMEPPSTVLPVVKAKVVPKAEELTHP